jgi:hypothetical protein
MAKGTGSKSDALFRFNSPQSLEGATSHSRRALVALLDLERNGLALAQGLEALPVYLRVVDEDIAAIVTLYEAETLGLIEPLDFSCSQYTNLLSPRSFLGSPTGGWYLHVPLPTTVFALVCLFRYERPEGHPQ